MNIHKIHFVKSILNSSDKPIPNYPEIAVVGRSNVGKSSFINTLFNRKNLAKTSSTPGKTRLINYFNVDDQIYIVDLPGYGYAKISKKEKSKWKDRIESYLTKNQELKLVFQLIDSRHPLLPADRKMLDWLEYFNIPVIIILTKTDKISRNQLTSTFANLSKEYTDFRLIGFSTKNGRGREEVWDIVVNTASPEI